MRKWSTTFDIFSIGQMFADTIGVLGGGFIPLCIFGRIYKLGVLHSLSYKYLYMESEMSPVVYGIVMKFCTFFLCFSVRLVSSGW